MPTRTRISNDRPALLSLSWKAIGVAATAIGYGVGVWLFLTSRLDAAFDKRLAPYDLLAQAQNLERRQQWDEAAAAYRDVRARVDSTRATRALMYLVYDGLLHSIVNTDMPERYSQELTAIEARTGSQIPRTGYRLHELGFYFLHVGDTAKARQYLTESWHLRRKNSERADGAFNQYNLGILAVAQGNLSAALEYLRGAVTDNPKEFRLPDLAADFEAESKWGREMSGLYGDGFGERWRRVADSLQRDLAGEMSRRARRP
jgi:tetratricopeptide (TPR) repeat protein